MKRLIAGTLVAFSAVLLVSCASARGGSNPFQETTAAKKEIHVFITNLAFMDATVYGVVNGARRRLGRVTGKRETRFKRPLPVPAEFWLEVDILAGPRCRTERVYVSPGEHLELIIQTNNPYLICGSEQ